MAAQYAHLVMDDVHIRNRKSRFFSKMEKNRNLDFMHTFCDQIAGRDQEVLRLRDHVRSETQVIAITLRRSATVQTRPTTDVW